MVSDCIAATTKNGHSNCINITDNFKHTQDAILSRGVWLVTFAGPMLSKNSTFALTQLQEGDCKGPAFASVLDPAPAG